MASSSSRSSFKHGGEVIDLECAGTDSQSALLAPSPCRTRNSKAGHSDSPHIPCDECGASVRFSEFAQHAAAHKREKELFAKCAVLEPGSAVALAVDAVEKIRTALDDPLQPPPSKRQKLSGSAESWIPKHEIKPLKHKINFDLSLSFVRRMRALSLHGDADRRKIIVVYHWTDAKNFSSIEETNLLVPSGSNGPKVANGSAHGLGIYTATQFHFASCYGNGAKECFLCLALPGRQYETAFLDYGISLKDGFDSHLAGHAPFKGAVVLFSSDQLLPCFLVDAKNYQLAAAHAQQVADHLSKEIMNIPEEDAACSIQELVNKRNGSVRRKPSGLQCTCM